VAEASITHFKTGERITFVQEDPLVMEDEVPAGGGRGREHVHPSQTESFEVTEIEPRVEAFDEAFASTGAAV